MTASGTSLNRYVKFCTILKCVLFYTTLIHYTKYPYKDCSEYINKALLYSSHCFLKNKELTFSIEWSLIVFIITSLSVLLTFILQVSPIFVYSTLGYFRSTNNWRNPPVHQLQLNQNQQSACLTEAAWVIPVLTELYQCWGRISKADPV